MLHFMFILFLYEYFFVMEASGMKPILSCPIKVILRHGYHGQVICNMSQQLGGNKTYGNKSSLHLNLQKLQNTPSSNLNRTKINSSLEDPMLVANRTTLKVIFYGVKCKSNGTYILNLMSGNKSILFSEEFSVIVSDVPRQPKSIRPWMDISVDWRLKGLRVQVELSKRNDCKSSLEDTYVLKYELKIVCSNKCKGNSTCQLKADYYVCYIPQIKVCDKNSDIMDGELNLTVQGHNELGYGPPRTVLTRNLRCTVPLYPVNEVKILTAESKLLKIQWRRPDCRAISYIYRVTLKEFTETDKGTHWKDHKPVPIKDCTTMLCPYTAKSLQPFTKYKICITAKDDDRFCEPTWNEPTCIEHSTLEDAPSSPPIITEKRGEKTSDGHWKITLKWKPPIKSDLNGILQTFEISHTEVNHPKDWRTKVVNANTTEYIIGNLERDREYLVKVSACNSNSGKDKDRKCSDSASQYIKLSNPSGNSNTNVTTKILLGVIVGGVLLILLILVISCSVKRLWKRGNQRYQQFKDDMGPVGPREGGIGHYEDIEEERIPNRYDEVAQNYSEIPDPPQPHQDEAGNEASNPGDVQSQRHNEIEITQNSHGEEPLVELRPMNT